MITDGIGREAWLINNPAIAAYILWIFARECFEKNATPIQPAKMFCVLQFVFYEDTRNILASTTLNSSLAAYISKLSTSKSCSSDITLSIHNRVDIQKDKTLEAMITAFHTGLLMIDNETGLILPNMSICPLKRAELDDTTKEMFDCARRLGRWFADLNIQDITRIIKVVF
jgi:hypothetical protein